MLLNKTTKKWIDAYINRPAATLFIDSDNDAQTGVEIAQYIHQKLVPKSNNPLITLKVGDKKSIGIEEVRNLQKTLSLSANKSEGISRIAMIEQAELLTIEAQNALLKLIEELPARTLLLLVCSEKGSILTTVLSRCFLLQVLPIDKSAAMSLSESKKIPLAEAEKAFLISEGRSSVFVSIIEGREDTLTEKIKIAKVFLQKSTFDKQVMLQQILTKDFDPLMFVHSVKLVAKAGLRNAKDLSQKKKWKRTLQSTITAEHHLKANVSPKLVLLNLSMNT